MISFVAGKDDNILFELTPIVVCLFMLSLLAAITAQTNRIILQPSPVVPTTLNQARDSRAGLETQSSSGQQDKRPKGGDKRTNRLL
jgi:hypothetical protein